MREPIKSGDRARVISGMGREKSPNIGLEVKVVSLQGDHSQWGRMWRCHGAGIKHLSESGLSYIELDHGDFAQDWLEKIEPDAPPPQATTTERELVA